jgi:hypothetical protein
LRRSLLFRIGYNEGITALQQWLLLYIMTGRDFDLVDFFICELEDVIMDGMTVHREQPFAHWICWILAQLGQNAHMDMLEQSRMHSRFTHLLLLEMVIVAREASEGTVEAR